MLIEFPRRPRHARASTKSSETFTGRKKASIGTLPPLKSLSLLASPSEASLRPAKMLRRCDSEHSAAVAISRIVLPFPSAQRSIGCSDMAATISTGNTESQPQIFPLEISSELSGLLQCDMGKTSRKPKYRPAALPEGEAAPLYVDEWMKACEVPQKQVVTETGYSQSHIANTQGSRRPNPSADLLRRIAAVLQISIDDLYFPPPPKDRIAAIRGLKAAREALLLQAMDTG